jgi:hypothetical protein
VRDEEPKHRVIQSLTMDFATAIPQITTVRPTAKEHVQRSIQANKDHQAALKTYTERLEAELAVLDRFVVRFDDTYFSEILVRPIHQAAADVNEDDEPDLDVGGFISVPGSARATVPVPSNEFLLEVRK